MNPIYIFYILNPHYITVMQEGPSKEELQNYWNNSRQYFDELAKSYRESDPEYYNKFIAPFYNSPFQTRSSTGSNSGAAKLLVALVLFGVIAAGGIAVFVLMLGQSKDKSKNNPEKRVITETPKADSVNVTALGDSLKFVTNSADYNVALTYFHAKDYDNAEKYFKMVPKTDKNYRSSQKYLKEIEIIRGIEVEPTPVPKPNNNRKQPIERIR